MANRTGMTGAGSVSIVIGVFGWVLFGYSVLVPSPVGGMGLERALQAVLAGLLWAVAFLIGFVDYLVARKRTRKGKKIARPYGLILSGVPLSVFFVWFLANRLGPILF